MLNWSSRWLIAPLNVLTGRSTHPSGEYLPGRRTWISLAREKDALYEDLSNITTPIFW